MKREAFKIGRRKLGEIIHHPSGRKIMVITRTRNDVFRGKGNAFISHAIEEGVAAWSVETMLLSKMKMRGIDIIAVKVSDTGERYITTLHHFIADSRVMTTRKRNGSMQRSLPFSFWRKREGVVKL